MDIRIANQQLADFIDSAVMNDLSDARMAAKDNGGYEWWSHEREPDENGTKWVQIGGRIMVCDASESFVEFLHIASPDIFCRRLRAQLAAVQEALKVEDVAARYLILIALARQWEGCKGWDDAWDLVPVNKSAIHYADELAYAVQRGMPEGTASHGAIAGGWL